METTLQRSLLNVVMATFAEVWCDHNVPSLYFFFSAIVTIVVITWKETSLTGMLLRRGMGNGEWGMGNGEWGMRSSGQR